MTFFSAFIFDGPIFTLLKQIKALSKYRSYIRRDIIFKQNVQIKKFIITQYRDATNNLISHYFFFYNTAIHKR